MKRVFLSALVVLLVPVHTIVAILVFVVSVGLGIPKLVRESLEDAIETFCVGPSFRSMFALIWKSKGKE